MSALFKRSPVSDDGRGLKQRFQVHGGCGVGSFARQCACPVFLPGGVAVSLQSPLSDAISPFSCGCANSPRPFSVSWGLDFCQKPGRSGRFGRMLSLLRAFPYFWSPVLINENYENDFFDFEIAFSKISLKILISLKRNSRNFLDFILIK